MRSLSFLFSRRWIIFLIVVIALAWFAVWLGDWQFHRLEERKDRNALIERNIAAEPAPVTDVMSTDTGVDAAHQWRRVTATGEYDVANTVVVRYRTRDGASGVDVVVPLITADGTALLIDRGWMSTDNKGTRPEDVAAPPEGEVEITGWARRDAGGDSSKVSDHSTRSINSERIAAATGLTTYRGFVDLIEESPQADTPLEAASLPDRTNGPHFFYGLQWWFFGLLAVIGFFWMAYDEWRGKSSRAPGASQRAKRAAVDGDQSTADE